MMVNELFSSYLALNNARQCKPLIDWAEVRQGLTEADFTSGEFTHVRLCSRKEGRAGLPRKQGSGRGVGHGNQAGKKQKTVRS